MAADAKIKVGRQTPTRSVVLPYSQTEGKEAIELYNKTGRTAQEWQELLTYDLMAKNDEGLWTHVKFGYSVPRRNGKSELLIIRELYGIRHGERILHTAHRTTTSHSAWERIGQLLAKTGLVEGEDYRTIKQFGLERIEMLKGEGRINFRTRSSKGGLGEGYDTLIIDEAQEYTDDQETALMYVVSDSRNPQTIYCGTPPTTVSAGTVFQEYRGDVLAGQKEDSGWAEWSVNVQADPYDTKLWYETNPSMGTILTERKVRAEIKTEGLDFNIQRLGLWLSYNQHSAISEPEWDGLAVKKLPELKGKLFVGIKYGINGVNVSMSIAVKTEDNRIFIETIDCRSQRKGNLWITSFLKKAMDSIEKIVVDGSGYDLLHKRMKDAKVRKKPIKVLTDEIITAHTLFEEAISSGTICHMNQPSLRQCATNCEHREIGSKGGWGYRSLRDDIDISILDSAVLAFWQCHESKEKRKQKVNY